MTSGDGEPTPKMFSGMHPFFGAVSVERQATSPRGNRPHLEHRRPWSLADVKRRQLSPPGVWRSVSRRTARGGADRVIDIGKQGTEIEVSIRKDRHPGRNFIVQIQLDIKAAVQKNLRIDRRCNDSRNIAARIPDDVGTESRIDG